MTKQDISDNQFAIHDTPDAIRNQIYLEDSFDNENVIPTEPTTDVVPEKLTEPVRQAVEEINIGESSPGVNQRISLQGQAQDVMQVCETAPSMSNKITIEKELSDALDSVASSDPVTLNADASSL